MHVRCGKCHGALWVDPADVSDTAACRSCGHEFALERARRIEAARGQLVGTAREFAKEHGVDLPGAYSVLLGIMTLEQVCELGLPGPLTGPQLPDPGPEHRRGAISFDPAFRPAVSAGLLTPLQAAARGKRSAFAEALTHRHGLPMAVALDVADNRISLLQALRERGPVEPQAGHRTKAVADPSSPGLWAGLPRTFRIAVCAFAVVGVPAAGVLLLSPEQGESRQVLGAEVRTDADGQVLRVTAPDPWRVLDGYCAADSRQRFQALGAVTSARHGPSARLGLLRWTGKEGALFAIDIREDRSIGRWVAGDGHGPLVPRPAPRDAEKAIPPGPGSASPTGAFSRSAR